MGEIVRVGGLEIDQDLELQGREWKLGRLAWSFFALLVVAGLLGLLGHGPLAHASASEGGLEVRYARFARYMDPERLTVRSRAEGGEVRIWIARETLEAIEVERWLPEPSRVEVRSDGSVFLFDAGAAEVLEVEVRFEHRAVGVVDVSLGAEPGPTLKLRAFVYP